MDSAFLEWLDRLIARTHNGPFVDPNPEAVVSLSMTTLNLLRNRIADLEERLAEYDNDAVYQNRYITHLKWMSENNNEG